MNDHEAHCRRHACPCDHTACYRGWRDHHPTGTTPCDQCRPDTYRRWTRREEARHRGWPSDALQRIMQARGGEEVRHHGDN